MHVSFEVLVTYWFICLFLPHEAAMLARSWDRNSVCPSVRLSHACFMMKRNTADILTPHERVVTVVF